MRFQSYLKNVHHLDVPDHYYMPQFADDIFKAELPLKMPSEYVELVFAGNIGIMQSVETLIRAAALLRNYSLRWHFVGDGSSYEDCRQLAHELQLDEKVIFYGRKPLEEMPKYYAMADAMLVSMKDDISFNETLPGKVQSYMAVGKPILGSITGETACLFDVVKCGLCAPPEDPEAFAEVVKQFLGMPDREEMGKRGAAYYAQYFTKKQHMDKLESLLLEMAGEKRE